MGQHLKQPNFSPLSTPSQAQTTSSSPIIITWRSTCIATPYITNTTLTRVLQQGIEPYFPLYSSLSAKQYTLNNEDGHWSRWDLSHSIMFMTKASFSVHDLFVPIAFCNPHTSTRFNFFICPSFPPLQIYSAWKSCGCLCNWEQLAENRGWLDI